MDNLSKVLILSLLFLTLFGAGLCFLVFWPETKQMATFLIEPNSADKNANVADFFNIPKTNSGGTSDNQQAREAVLMFVGDIMLSRRVGALTTKQGDWHWPFLKIADYLQGADLLFGNLESMISDKGRNIGSKYSFRADPRMLDGLTLAGFDVLCLANNHVGDWTRLAFEDTMERLVTAGINYSGAGWTFEGAHQAAIRDVGGTKVGILCYTDLAPVHMKASVDKSGIAWLDISQMKKDVAQAKAQTDIVVVSMHQGVEYAAHPNKYQKDFSHAAIDAGANLVVGHHPHVVQDLEEYQGGWIAYSLGNFIFDQDFSEETMHGWLLRVTLRNKKIISVKPIDVLYDKNFQPEISVSTAGL